MTPASSTPIADGVATTREGMRSQLPADLFDRFDAQAEALAARSWRPPSTGDAAPSFALESSTGEAVELGDLLAGGPVVLTFYRGDWCPYCNVQLRAYQEALGDIVARGAQLVAVSPQSADHGRQLVSDAGLTYQVLTDPGARVAARYGLAFAIGDEDQEPFDEAGLDVAGSNADGEWNLPTPGTFVIDGDGTILAAFVNGDFRRRTEPAEILAALDASA